MLAPTYMRKYTEATRYIIFALDNCLYLRRVLYLRPVHKIVASITYGFVHA